MKTILADDKYGYSVKLNSTIIRLDRVYSFIDIFRQTDGFQVTSNVLKDNAISGIEFLIKNINNKIFYAMLKAIVECDDKLFTKADPQGRSYPALIDVGVMASCENGLSGKCIAGKVQCYQNGKNIKLPHMTLEVFKNIVDQSYGKSFQYALGGRGDVNQHPQFKEIMEYCRKREIIPNYTTSGLDLTDEQVSITKNNAGAVAVSWYRQQHTIDAINKFIKANITTNIHYVLSNETIDEAISQLKYFNDNDNILNGIKPFPDNINAVIFLCHKPIGLGTKENVLNVKDYKIKEFFNLIDNGKFPFKIGFDSCSIPGVVNFCKNINMSSCDSCEGSRMSCYINAQGIMVPCSFDQDLKWGCNINKMTIKEAWDSPQFKNFSISFNSCPNCKDRLLCLGGCPIVNEITLCSREERTYY